MAKELKGFVTFNHPDGGRSETFGPGDELPDWAAKQVTDEHTGEEADDAADLPVPGPGQLPGEGMSEEEKAAARKEADRVRKANARAAAKKASDDAAALKAAQDAEAQRAAEEAAKAGQGGA